VMVVCIRLIICCFICLVYVVRVYDIGYMLLLFRCVVFWKFKVEYW